jgi:hypothetical protein
MVATAFPARDVTATDAPETHCPGFVMADPSIDSVVLLAKVFSSIHNTNYSYSFPSTWSSVLLHACMYLKLPLAREKLRLQQDLREAAWIDGTLKSKVAVNLVSTSWCGIKVSPESSDMHIKMRPLPQL